MSTTSDSGESPPLEPADWIADDGVSAADEAITRPSVSVGVYRETTRSQLARWLMGLLTITVLVVLLLAGLQAVGIVGKTAISIQDVAQTILTPVVTLTATALGFYFGAQSAEAGGSSDMDLPAPRKLGWFRRLVHWVW